MRRAQRHSGYSQNEGMALLLVLVFIALLTIIVVEYAFESSVEASFVENHMDSLKAYEAAKSGVANGLGLLAADFVEPGDSSEELDDSYFDVWGAPPQLKPLIYTSTAASGQAAPPIFMTTISDEYGKIPLNALLRQVDPNDPEALQEPDGLLVRVLTAFFEERGLTEDPTDAILDWLDTDDETRPNGAENDYFQSLSIPYLCKNGPMDSVEELLLIPGITPEIFWGLPPENPDLPPDQLPLTEIFSVFGHPQGKININTAELEVLRAYGIALNLNSLEEEYQRVREDSPYASIEELENLNPPQLDPNAPYDPETPRPLLDVFGRNFRIRGDGASGDASVRIEAYVQRLGDEGAAPAFRRLDWRVIR